MNTCDNCKYWQKRNGIETWGRCHFNPPVVLFDPSQNDTATCWPATDKDEWCGKWEEDKE